MATIICVVIGLLIGLLAHHIIYFTLIGGIIGYRVDSQAYAGTATLGILGVIIGAIAHHMMIIPLVGLIIGFFIDEKFIMPILDRKEAEIIKAERQRQAVESKSRYAENHVSNKLSESVRTYLQTGKVDENYYSYSNYSYCSPKINKQINAMLNDCKNLLLQFSKNKQKSFVHEYHTNSGTIMEISLFLVWEHNHFWEQEEDIKKSDSSYVYYIDMYKGSTGAEYWKSILEKQGFIVKEDEEPRRKEDETVRGWGIYAYIKL